MRLTVSRESLIRVLQPMIGVVEKRKTMPILANILLDVQDGQLSCSGTDTEIEIMTFLHKPLDHLSGMTTVNAKKLLDIMRVLPEDAEISLKADDKKMFVESGSSRFSLTTLPANDFPKMDENCPGVEFELSREAFKTLLDKVSFSMAQQDVRYYLNGMLLELSHKHIRTVSADGHRLSISTYSSDIYHGENTQCIVPRKAVTEISRLLANDSSEKVLILLSNNHIQIKSSHYRFISKLIESKFPNYESVIPKNGDKKIVIDRLTFKDVLARSSIIRDERFNSVELQLRSNILRVHAKNADQEEVFDELIIDYTGDDLDIAFNVSYLIDVFGIIPSDKVIMTLCDSDSSILIEGEGDSENLYIVMPLRL